MSLQATMPKNQVWAVYNAVPGGQMVAIHFEDSVRRVRRGGQEEEIVFTAKDQLEAFRRTPQVALCVKGVLQKNQVLVYEGPAVQGRPDAADRVLEWARERGAEPVIARSSEKDPLPHEHTRRIELLESRVNEMGGKIDKILEAVSRK